MPYGEDSAVLIGLRGICFMGMHLMGMHPLAKSASECITGTRKGIPTLLCLSGNVQGSGSMFLDSVRNPGNAESGKNVGAVASEGSLGR